MNQKEFARKYKVSPKTVKTWYEKNYLPGSWIDEKTHEFHIYESTPKPYGIQANVIKLSVLAMHIMKAADLGNSVYNSMFPKIDNSRYTKMLKDLIDNKYIKEEKTDQGAVYLTITSNGIMFMRNLKNSTDKEKKDFDEKLKSGKDIVKAIWSVWPYIEMAISTIPK